SYTVTLGGGGTCAAGTEATATAVGIVGGEESDLLKNAGTISLSSSSTVVSDSQSYEFVGVGIADADSMAEAFAIGIDGGDGCNKILNTQTGVVDVSAVASATATDMSASFGITAASASTTANAFSTGLRSGNNDDHILNQGSLNINATTKTAAGIGQFSILGLAVGDALTKASANGIDAGGGNDTVINEGSITVGSVEDNNNPMAYAEVANATFTFTSISITAFEADAQAIGVLGGSGDDRILNSGTIAVGDDNWMAKSFGYGFTGEFFQILGLASIDTRADSVSLGIAGGTADDRLVNDADGVLTVKAASYSEAEGAGDTSLGSNVIVASSSAEATATGISGGAGIDLIKNIGTIDSYAHSLADSYATAFVGWGEPVADAKTDAAATATGITAESGQNQIANCGSINATSLAETLIYAEGDSNIDDTNSKATSHARSTALGILGGNDGNFVINTDLGTTNTDLGTITVTSTARTMARSNEKDSGDPIEAAAVSDEYATDTAGSAKEPITAIAKGISLGSGDDTIINAGLVDVDAQSYAESSALSDSAPYKAKSISNAYGKAEASGFAAGEGSNLVENSGQLDISALSNASAEANSYSGLSTSETEANSDAQASATGVQGNGEIWNLKDGSIAVKAQAITSAITGYNIEEESEDTIATAKLTATATGITTASDNTRPEQDRISNEGSISVEAVTGDDSNGYAAYAWVDTDSRHNIATAKGSSGVDAVGIGVGDNSAEITNVGELNVTGKARVRVFAHSDSGSVAEIGVDDDTAVQAEASGIEAGNGNNTVTNTDLGSITVESEANIYSKSEASDAEETTNSTTKAGGSSVATGIKVGNGENTVKNYNHLEVTAKTNATALSTYDVAHLDQAYAYAGAVDTSLTANAAGISAGDGINVIENYKNINVESTVDVDSSANSNTSQAYTYTESRAGGKAEAIGIVVGGGENTITNFKDGTITVTAKADGYAYGYADEMSYTYVGSAGDPGAIAEAIGISLGSGDDTVTNAGVVTVHAESIGASNASSNSYPYTAKSVSNSYGKADAWGIVAGEGSNLVENSGQLDITAVAAANPQANSYSETSTSSTEAKADAQASATGMQGNNEISNLKDGSIEVRAQATTHSVTGNIEEESEDTTATAKLTATATGITTASDNTRPEPDRIQNDGSIRVEAVTGEDSNEYAAYAWVNCDDNNNYATAKGGSDVDAAGIRVGHHSAEITNVGELNVTG
ncbi:MAG: hypothetical protein OEM61_05470, partial [Desulfobacteraceae bacterium]|nr:hypothetical protein [Desulfobacteraceae bacterium]